MHRYWILFLPFFTECRQLAHGLFFYICLIYQLEVFHEFLDVFIAHKSGAAADLVDDAPLYPCLGINSHDCFFEAGQVVYAEQRNVLCPSVFSSFNTSIQQLDDSLATPHKPRTDLIPRIT